MIVPSNEHITKLPCKKSCPLTVVLSEEGILCSIQNATYRETMSRKIHIPLSILLQRPLEFFHSFENQHIKIGIALATNAIHIPILQHSLISPRQQLLLLASQKILQLNVRLCLQFLFLLPSSPSRSFRFLSQLPGPLFSKHIRAQNLFATRLIARALSSFLNTL